MNLDQVVRWLKDMGEADAASILSHCSLESNFVDVAFGNYSETAIYDANIRVPARFMRLIKGSLSGTVPVIENAIKQFAEAEGSHFRSITWLPKPASDPSAAELAIERQLTNVDSVHVRKAWDKAVERQKEDPEGAITAARTLLEHVCLIILHRSQVKSEDNADLPRLFYLACTQLNLSPSQQVEESLKRILGNCQNMVSGIANLRNVLSDAHGKSPGDPMPDAATAEFVVNLAGACATYLIAKSEMNKVGL